MRVLHEICNSKKWLRPLSVTDRVMLLIIHERDWNDWTHNSLDVIPNQSCPGEKPVFNEVGWHCGYIGLLHADGIEQLSIIGFNQSQNGIKYGQRRESLCYI